MASAPEAPRQTRAPTYLEAAIPLLALVGLVAASVALFGLDAVNGPMQVGMVLATMVAIAVILRKGTPGKRSPRPGARAWPRWWARSSSCWRSAR